MEPIEWFDIPTDDDEILVVAARIKEDRADEDAFARRTNYQRWGLWRKITWWCTFLFFACPWALCVGLIGILLIWFPPFGVPLLAIAGAPGGLLMSWRMDRRDGIGFRKALGNARGTSR
jgi:hypothetical protein